MENSKSPKTLPWRLKQALDATSPVRFKAKGLYKKFLMENPSIQALDAALPTWLIRDEGNGQIRITEVV